MSKIILRISFAFLILAGFFDCFSQKKQVANKPQNALLNYIKKRDSTFKWDDYKVITGPDGVYYEMNLVSQTWQTIIWRHKLIVYIPSKATSPNIMLLVLRHIYNRDAGLASLKIISDSTNTSSAILYDVPNQPLFDGREEDDLQAYTFSQYIKTGDESWPLLFPMVKSVVQAMDAVQNLTRTENKTIINGFIIAGHSKRGHTTWLTAAADLRVKGIIPIAIDILNSSAQLPHHLQAFGEYSTPSKAATEFLQELQLPRGKNLIKMVDAYSYKEQLTLPKLIVSATNDDFFTTDALNLYWDGLKGPKRILYLSNANHVSADSDPRINPTAFAFVRAVAAGTHLPVLTWEYRQYKKVIHLIIKCAVSASKARLWTSYAKSKNFRQAKWTSQPMKLKFLNSTVSKESNKLSKECTIDVVIPPKGYMAIFGEIEFTQDGHTFLLSTQTNISSLESKKIY